MQIQLLLGSPTFSNHMGSQSDHCISLEFSLNGTGQNHFCMNWGKFIDHVSYLCLGVSVVPLWLAAQEVASSNIF